MTMTIMTVVSPSFQYTHSSRRRRQLIYFYYCFLLIIVCRCSNLHVESFSSIATTSRKRIRRFNNNVKNVIQRQRRSIFNFPNKVVVVKKKKKKDVSTTSIATTTTGTSTTDTAADLDRQLMNISFFSFLHQASTPFSELIDSAYLSKMDSTSLGAMGVAMSSQNSVSKLYNSPLSKTTISLVASYSSVAGGGDKARMKEESCDDEEVEASKKLSSAISAALLLASLVGILQLLLFTVGANSILHISGVSSSNIMHSSALSYTKARALGAPFFTLWLVLNNIFRGLGDAKSPLLAALIFNIINIVTDHIFLRTLNLGIVGSALASGIAQAVSLLPLLWMLKNRVPNAIDFRQLDYTSFMKYLSTYGKASVFLLGRSIARTAAYSYSSRRAALLGPVAASSYCIMYQIGLWITMACEGIAIANQSLLSRIFATTTTTKSFDDANDPSRRRQQQQNNNNNISSQVKHLVKRSIQAGILSAGLFSGLVFAFWPKVISTFTKSPEIQQAAASTLPIFLVAQIIKGFSFPMNGIIMGGMDWSAAMFSMCASNVACFLTMKFIRDESANILWLAWVASYAAQGIVLFIRYKSRTGSAWSRLSKSSESKSE